MQVKIINKSNNPTPKYETQNSAGFDIAAFIVNEHNRIVIEPYTQKVIGTGLYMEVPQGYYLQLKSRSGLAVKQNLHVGAGIIDADYRGEIRILLVNQGEAAQVINSGDRIAQGIIIPYVQANFELVSELSETMRGDGGFGSTGVGVKQSDVIIKNEPKETPQVLDLSELKEGDSVEFRDGEIEKVLTIKFNEQSLEPYKLSGEHFSETFTKNGRWCWTGGETGNDIVRIIKA